MAGKVKTWVWVVVGIAVVGILGLVAMAGIAIYMASQHFETTAATPATAAQQFEDVRKQFGEQMPLIELDERGRFLKSNTDRKSPDNATAPEAIYVMAYDPDDEGGRVVRVSIPFWLLRLNAGNQTIDFNGNKMDLEDLKLTVQDLERMGPTLIVDHRERSGERVLVWSK